MSVLRASGGCSFTDWEADAAVGCAGYASGTCQALARCGEAFLAPYGSYDACEAQLSQGCAYSLGLPDVFGSGAGAAICGEMMLSIDCNAITNGELPAGCQAPSGMRSDGAPCLVGSQCASARCAEYAGEWGVCKERVAWGEACLTQADCQSGLVCSAFGTCVVLGRSGEICNAQRACRAPLACVAGTCISVDAAPTCQAFADTLCAQLATCSESGLVSAYGDQPTCAARNAESCLANFAIDPATRTAAGAAIAGCSLALASASCTQLLDHALPVACQLAPGWSANGQSCNSDAQCASTRCARGAGSTCGVCTLLGGAGDPCTADSDCSSGAFCGGGTCRVPGVLGASCDMVQRCAYPWTCAAGSCVEAAGLGAACSYAADSCNRYQGLMCGTARTCERWLIRSAGQPCNLTESGWAACSGGSTCIHSSEGDLCSGALADGSPCNPSQPPFCLAPEQCLGGVCALASPTMECP